MQPVSGLRVSKRRSVIVNLIGVSILAATASLPCHAEMDDLSNIGHDEQITLARIKREVIVEFDQIPSNEFLSQMQQQFPAIQGWRPLPHAPHYKDRPGIPHPLAYFRVANIADDADRGTLATQLSAKGDIVSAEPNEYATLAYVPDDPKYNQQYSPQIIESEDAWDITQGNSEIIVAVLDTGLNFTHEDLVDGVWANDDPVNGIDDDNNGFVDDYHGWDFNQDDHELTEDWGHGTHVSGIIAAGLSNSVGIAGMSCSTIMPLQVFGPGPIMPYDAMAAAAYYAVDNGARVINLSGGGQHDMAVVASSVRYAWDNGVSYVAAAHNYNSDEKIYPAAYPEVVSVAATDANDERADFSNFGDWIDVAAPGVDVLSCWATYDNSYSLESGTSMSSPHTAGLVALMYAHEPRLTPAKVLELLRDNAVDLGDPGFDIYYGYGRIDALATLSAVEPPACLSLEVMNLIHGQTASWIVSGLTPGERTVIVFGFQEGETEFDHVANYCVTFGINGITTSSVIGHPVAGGNGVAVQTKKVPGGAAGVTVLMQAAERGTCPRECTSEVVTRTIE